MTQTSTSHLFHAAAGWSPYVVVGTVLAALIVLRLLAVLVAKLGRNPHPYVAAPSLLTPAEQRFFVALRQAISSEYLLFAKVRLADILQLDRSVSGKHRWKAFTSISSKHADFVVCDPRTFRVLGVIELDDSSHRRRDRQERDEFFNAAFAAAAIPVWRVPVQRSYAPEPLREQARAFLSTASRGFA